MVNNKFSNKYAAIRFLSCHAMAEVFRRNATHCDSPQGKLMLAVIEHGLMDYDLKFFNSQGFQNYAVLIGLPHEFASSIAIQWIKAAQQKEQELELLLKGAKGKKRTKIRADFNRNEKYKKEKFVKNMTEKDSYETVSR